MPKREHNGDVGRLRANCTFYTLDVQTAAVREDGGGGGGIDS